jgi:hypothetical protein
VVTSAKMAVAASVSVPATARVQAIGRSGNPAIQARNVTMGIRRWSLIPT